jgi:hypothetical protein
MQQLYDLARSGKLSDVLVHSIGAALQVRYDRKIALLAPVQCHATGWTSRPLSSLTPEERQARK